MRVNVLQHVPFENEALIGEWAKERGHDLSRTLCWEGGRELRPEDFDLLVIMGGPMSVTDADRYPFLLWEKQLIKMAVARGKKVLGICLGAQLIADALGGEVDRSSEREIGVFSGAACTRCPACLGNERFSRNVRRHAPGTVTWLPCRPGGQLLWLPRPAARYRASAWGKRA